MSWISSDSAARALVSVSFTGKREFATGAGVVCGQTGRPLEEAPEERWRAVVAINMSATLLLAQSDHPAVALAETPPAQQSGPFRQRRERPSPSTLRAKLRPTG